MGRLTRAISRARGRATKRNTRSALRDPVWAVITRDDIQVCGVRYREATRIAQHSGGSVVTNAVAARMAS